MVSILVFVEFAQRRRSSAPARVRHCDGFNPCFCGIRSTALRRLLDLLQPIEVSILVFVEFAQRLAGVRLVRRVTWMFQSLFLWNSLNGEIVAATDRRPGSVSILVFVEFAQRRGSDGLKAAAASGVSILVFVEFAHRPQVAHHDDSAERSCFNPCFCGIRSTAATPSCAKLLCLDVSILVFVEFAQRRPGTTRRPCLESGVSILVFVEFAQRRVVASRHLRPSTTSFNPCFCGIRSTAVED